MSPEPYGRRTRAGPDVLDALLRDLGRSMDRDATAWDIGGAPMVYRGLKAATKDIDLVLETSGERDALTAVLLGRGYETFPVEGEYEGLEGVLLRKEGAVGVDLFVDTIMQGLRLSRGMKHRAGPPRTFGRLTIHECANEDIFLLKAVTKRPDDDDDVLILAGTGLDAAAMKRELLAQQARSDRNWPWIVLRALEAIEQRKGVPLPIKGDLVD